MNNPNYLSKINELKAELEEELEKEEPNMFIVERLRVKIIGLGMQLTTRDINKNRYG